MRPHGCASARCLGARREGQCPGLDGALSAPTTRSAKQPARGPRHRAVGTSIRAAQRGARRSADGNVDKTPHYTSGDAMAPGC
jgi:hypothetical protein